MENISLKKRNKGIDFLKFLAMLLITWSHFDSLLPDDIHNIAAGGALGDALFFFCSGYTLSLGRFDDFPNWYKRRINRIYPTILMWALISSLFFGYVWNAIDLIIIKLDYWFLSCIMLYYFVFYFVHKFAWDKIIAFSCFLFVVVTIISPFVFDVSSLTLYYQYPYMFTCYFFFVLEGAILAKMDKQETGKINVSTLALFSLSLFSVVLYYVVAFVFKKYPSICIVQTITLIPLLFSIYFLLKFSETRFIARLFDKNVVGRVLYILSSLTLEIYIVQPYIVDNFGNIVFPLNLFVVFLLIVGLAYVLRIARNLFVLLFGDSPFSWSKLFAV